ncbi:MAG: type VI secretion system baseplate subunit TssG, partial [Acidobacteria bacterium]|nr:type VI secretion system baseplate subunit TssG [Acidobacteriota bacterium]
FWNAKRRPSGRVNDEGSEMFISLVDLSGRPVQPDLDTLTMRLTCSNRDLPSRLPFGNEAGDFELEEGASIRSVVALRKPTMPLRPATGKNAFWRLISHLSLNYLSLVSEGREALQEILRLYNATESTYAEKQIQGVIALSSKRHFARVISENGISFARGTRVYIEFDEEQFVGGGVYLFASVLEHFFGLYVSLNSFSQLSASTRQRKEVMKEEPWFQVEELLRSKPFSFQFFQAVRLLERIRHDRQPVGRFVHPNREIVRLHAHTAVGFPASQIQAADFDDPRILHLTVNFMGLFGPSGVLPLVYSDLINDRVRSKDRTLRDFLDIFNHRMISLFYQAWEKYRFLIAYERGERDRFSAHLMDLIGLGTGGLQNRQALQDDSLRFYSGLLSLTPRSETGLRQILGDYFGVAVRVEQFVGAWHALDPDTQCFVGSSEDYSEQLGVGAVVGDEIWDQQSGVRVILGPLTARQYVDFLPNGSAYAPLEALIRFFTRDEFDFEVQLVLKREETPACELGGEGEAGPQLGWVTWLKSAPLQHDPGDTILRM